MAGHTQKTYVSTEKTRANPDVKSVIAVMSGKGGVGKSTVATLLAIGLHRRGWHIGVLDADITGASIPKLFGLHQPPLVDNDGNIIPSMTQDGIKIISTNLMLPNEDDAVIWRGPLISKMIKQFWENVAWGTLDALIVDLPPGTSDAALTVMQSLPITGIVLVTTPQDLAGLIVRKAAHMAEQIKIPLLGIVENMSFATCPHCGARYELFGPGRSEALAAAFSAPLLARLGLDPALTQASDAGEIEQYSSDEMTALVDALLTTLEVE